MTSYKKKGFGVLPLLSKKSLKIEQTSGNIFMGVGIDIIIWMLFRRQKPYLSELTHNILNIVQDTFRHLSRLGGLIVSKEYEAIGP